MIEHAAPLDPFGRPCALLAVKVQVVGFHCWPGASGRRAYLGQRHRHVFHVTARCFAKHDEREVEFHDLGDMIGASLQSIGPRGDFGGRSCEAIARHVAGELAAAFGRPFSVEVSEDGECSATVSSTLPSA